jgi:hypothetical protein
LKMQFAVCFGPQRSYSKLFEGLAQCRLQGCFPWVDFTAGSVDLARPETSLFVNEQNFLFPDDEKKSGPHARLSGCPISHVAEESYTLSGAMDTGLMGRE